MLAFFVLKICVTKLFKVTTKPKWQIIIDNSYQ